MFTLTEFAERLELAINSVKGELLIGCNELGDEVVKTAKSYIGTERPEWPPLADSTVEQKEHLGYVDQRSATDPLLRTWALFDSIDKRTGFDGIGAELDVGSSSPYALFHEMGTSRMPPRPVYSLAMMKSIPLAEEIFGKLATSLLNPGVRIGRK